MKMAFKRALGALCGMAVGDALGMPTQSLARATIVDRYGPRITHFAPAPLDHPIAAGLPAGTITDDTEQALLLAHLLIESEGVPDPKEFAHRLILWEEDMRLRGSRDLLGPSTSRAIAELLSGTDISQSGRYGTTNGAAMRIAPLGIATPLRDLTQLVDQVEAVNRISHNTGLAIAGAAAIAAAVSAGIDGASISEATIIAIEAAKLAANRGFWVAGADVATRIHWAVSVITSPDIQQDVADIIYTLIGTSLACQESIPAAFAVLAVHPDQPWKACQLAASLGGDTDTIAAMVGAIAGACSGVDEFPSSVVSTVLTNNRLDLDSLTTSLLQLRNRAIAYGGGHL